MDLNTRDGMYELHISYVVKNIWEIITGAYAVLPWQKEPTDDITDYYNGQKLVKRCHWLVHGFQFCMGPSFGFKLW